MAAERKKNEKKSFCMCDKALVCATCHQLIKAGWEVRVCTQCNLQIAKKDIKNNKTQWHKKFSCKHGSEGPICQLLAKLKEEERLKKEEKEKKKRGLKEMNEQTILIEKKEFRNFSYEEVEKLNEQSINENKYNYRIFHHHLQCIDNNGNNFIGFYNMNNSRKEIGRSKDIQCGILIFNNKGYVVNSFFIPKRYQLMKIQFDDNSGLFEADAYAQNSKKPDDFITKKFSFKQPKKGIDKGQFVKQPNKESSISYQVFCDEQKNRKKIEIVNGSESFYSKRRRIE